MPKKIDHRRRSPIIATGRQNLAPKKMTLKHLRKTSADVYVNQDAAHANVLRTRLMHVQARRSAPVRALAMAAVAVPFVVAGAVMGAATGVAVGFCLPFLPREGLDERSAWAQARDGAKGLVLVVPAMAVGLVLGCVGGCHAGLEATQRFGDGGFKSVKAIFR